MHDDMLKVDHVNADSTDNALSNLQTLCANCHRYKTRMNEDWLSVRREQQLGSDQDLNS